MFWLAVVDLARCAEEKDQKATPHPWAMDGGVTHVEKVAIWLIAELFGESIRDKHEEGTILPALLLTGGV